MRSRLDTIISKRLPIIVGDANGVDKAVQDHLRSKNYPLVEVFCAGNQCRNNRGGWPIRAILSDEKRGFDFYASKDRIMASEASFGLMIWDGRSLGTLMNVLRLLRLHKKVVVYVGPCKAFVDLKSSDDWPQFIARHAADQRERVERQAASERRRDEVEIQPTLL
jgi:hypothetical protein